MSQMSICLHFGNSQEKRPTSFRDRNENKNTGQTRLLKLPFITFTFRSSFIASLGSAIASTPIDVIRVSIHDYMHEKKTNNYLIATF